MPPKRKPIGGDPFKARTEPSVEVTDALSHYMYFHSRLHINFAIFCFAARVIVCICDYLTVCEIFCVIAAAQRRP